jgi:hypothetical protein
MPKVKTKALDESNCGAARHRGKEAGVKPASSRTETDYEAPTVGNPIGTARYGPVRRVVWGPGANYSRLSDGAPFSLLSKIVQVEFPSALSTISIPITRILAEQHQHCDHAEQQA